MTDALDPSPVKVQFTHVLLRGRSRGGLSKFLKKVWPEQIGCGCQLYALDRPKRGGRGKR
jgi:hypothetical protein